MQIVLKNLDYPPLKKERWDFFTWVFKKRVFWGILINSYAQHI